MELGNRAWKNFKVHGRRNLHDHEQTIKAILLRGQKNRKAIEKASIFLELRIVNRLLIEIMAGKRLF